jgi:hypothetical protein
MLDVLGPAGVAGLGVLCFCLAFELGTLAPVRQDLEKRVAEFERGRQKPSALPVAAHRDELRLDRFYASFPPSERLTDEIAALNAHAKAAGIRLPQAEYRMDTSDAGLVAYRVTLPVRGSYGELRGFVSRVLEQMPTASVDGMSFQRRKASQGVLEAQIRLTIYLRTASVERRM